MLAQVGRTQVTELESCREYRYKCGAARLQYSPFIRMTSSVIDLTTPLLRTNAVIILASSMQSNLDVMERAVVRTSPHSATPTEHPARVLGKATPNREPGKPHPNFEWRSRDALTTQG